MTRFRKKPIEVEAWQVGTEPVPDWVDLFDVTDSISKEKRQVYWVAVESDDIMTGRHAYYGDWVIRDNPPKVVHPDIFEQTYEVVE